MKWHINFIRTHYYLTKINQTGDSYPHCGLNHPIEAGSRCEEKKEEEKCDCRQSLFYFVLAWGEQVCSAIPFYQDVWNQNGPGKAEPVKYPLKPLKPWSKLNLLILIWFSGVHPQNTVKLINKSLWGQI